MNCYKSERCEFFGSVKIVILLTDMGVCFSFFGCGDSTRTAVVPIGELSPDKWDSEKTNEHSQEKCILSEIGRQHSPLKDAGGPLKRSETHMNLPGQLIFDEPVDTPPRNCVQTADVSVGECVRRFTVLDNQQAKTGIKKVRASPPNGAADPVQQSSGLDPVKTTLPKKRPLSAWGEVKESSTVVNGPVPRPAYWKELYLRVLKPREQVMSIYLSPSLSSSASLPQHKEHSTSGAPNARPATRLETEHEDCCSSMARVQVQTPLAQRVDRLHLLRARVKRKLRKPRLKKKDSRRRASRGTSEWDTASVLSIGEDGDENEVILYSTYKCIDQDSEYFASDETDGREKVHKSTAVSLRREKRKLSASTVERSSLAWSSTEEEAATLNVPTATRTKSSSAAMIHETTVRIQREESCDDVEEVLVLTEERAEPSKARKARVLRNAFFTTGKKSSHSQVPEAVKLTCTGRASPDGYRGVYSSADQTLVSTTDRECADEEHSGVIKVHCIKESKVSEMKDSPRAFKRPPRFRWSPDRLFVRRFNAFESTTRDP